MKRVVAKARVRVTIEVDGGGPWGSDCSVDQMHRQAIEHALNFIPEGIIRVVDAHAIAVTIEEEER